MNLPRVIWICRIDIPCTSRRRRPRRLLMTSCCGWVFPPPFLSLLLPLLCHHFTRRVIKTKHFNGNLYGGQVLLTLIFHSARPPTWGWTEEADAAATVGVLWNNTNNMFFGKIKANYYITRGYRKVTVNNWIYCQIIWYRLVQGEEEDIITMLLNCCLRPWPCPNQREFRRQITSFGGCSY